MIHPESDTAELDAALSALWNQAVTSIGAQTAARAIFAMDWLNFRKQVNRSFMMNAQERFEHWLEPLDKRERSPGVSPEGSSYDRSSPSSADARGSKRARTSGDQKKD